MGERGDLKNLWKNFRLYLENKKKEKEKEEEIIRRMKKKKKRKDNFKLSLLIASVFAIRIIAFVIPSFKKEEIKLEDKKDLFKLKNKIDSIDDKINKAKNQDDLLKTRDELCDVQIAVEKKKETKEKEKVKNLANDKMEKLDKKLEELSPKKEKEITIDSIILPGVNALANDKKKSTNNIKQNNENIKKEKKEEKKNKINADIKEAYKIRSELDSAILFIEKQKELQNVLSNSKIQSKKTIFGKLVSNTLTTTVVTASLFANPAITLFANAVVINNTMRTMRKKMNKNVNAISVSEFKNQNIRNKEIERYTKSVFSNSLHQIVAFKKEFKENYKHDMNNPEVIAMLKEIDSIESYVKIQMVNMNKKVKEEVSYSKRR